MGIKATQLDLDEQPLPYQDNYFDFVFAGEILEHLFNPDNLFTEAHRVLKMGGSLMLTTPNLASWHNRIALMLGYQPYWSEISTKYNVGKFLVSETRDVSGHLRLFTLRGLKRILEIYHFKEIKSLRLFSSFSRCLIVSCKKC